MPQTTANYGAPPPSYGDTGTGYNTTAPAYTENQAYASGYPDDGPGDGRAEWRDVKTCIAFLLNTFIAFAVLLYTAKEADYDNLLRDEKTDTTPAPTIESFATPAPTGKPIDFSSHVGEGVTLFIGTLVFSVVMGAVSLRMLRTNTKCLLYTGAAVNLAMAIFIFILSGSFIALIIVLIISVMIGYIFCKKPQDIEFGIWVVQTATSIIHDHRSIVCLTFVWMLLQAAVVGAFFFGVLTANNVFGAIVALYMLFCVYWIEEVFYNVIGLTMSLITANWTIGLSVISDVSPVYGSFKHSLTYAFGSIAMGSLVVAFLKFLRTLARIAMSQSDSQFGIFILCCCTCFIGCLEGLAEWFNEWAYAYIGLYQKDYITSAGKVYNLLFNSDSGWKAIVNDWITGFILTCPPLISGIVCGVLVGVIAAHGMGWTSIAGVIAGFIAGIIAFVLVNMVMGLIDRAQNVIFLSYIENRQKFIQKHPEKVTDLERRLASKYPELGIQAQAPNQPYVTSA